MKKIPDKFAGRFRIASARLKCFDYGFPGMYFITICTKNRENFFGNIKRGRVLLSQAGHLASANWSFIPKQFPWTQLGAFIVMPNHIHGILSITEPRDAINGVSTSIGIHSLKGGITGSDNPMIRENISRVVRWFKGKTTFEIRKIISDFSWQDRFHDRIIRDEKELHRKTLYIEQNPENWEIEELF